jgi:Transcriptional regulatory protein, C terminal
MSFFIAVFGPETAGIAICNKTNELDTRNGGGAMGANQESVTVQGMPSATKPVLLPAPALDSSTQICGAGLEEIRRLSQFWALIILVPQNSVKDQTLPSESLSSSKMVSSEERLSGLSGKTVEPFQRPNPETESAFGEVTVNFSEMTACRNGKPVALTALEFKTLKYLIQNVRRVISRDELLNQVWGYENYPCTRTVDNHILRLRHKLEREPSRPVHFRTVHGAGYKFLP